MAKHSIDATAPSVQSLRRAVHGLSELMGSPSVDLLALGKGYRAVALAMCAVAKESGLGSVRFDAAAKALDLTTRKSTLVRFVEDA